MPKIEVYQKHLEEYMGKTYSEEEFENLLPAAKAELDGRIPDEGILKIELNDTNRPDLWSTAGLGRQFRIYETRKSPVYDFFSTADKTMDTGERTIVVDPELKDIRPYIAAFAVSGKKIDDASLKDIIQTQEKLCWNFGRKRKSIAMGVYRSDLFSYPVNYIAADPDTTKFTPLEMDSKLSLNEILEEHLKGKEFGHIVSGFKKYPFITDSKGGVLSFPPIINSSEIGAVKPGDDNLFIELTGTDLKSLLLAASIVACDLSDSGFTIYPVKTVYPYDTEFGREIVAPYYFQKPVSVDLEYANKLLGEKLTAKEAAEAVRRMGPEVSVAENVLTVNIPEYRNDYLHPIDIVEDIMIGRGMDSFEPVMPSAFTMGRLTKEEEFARKVKDIMIGLGFQEMMYNYLGSGRDYIERMNIAGDKLIQIANPMTENYEYVRDSIMPGLLSSEAVSANAVYPHNIFEIGKTAFLDPDENTGTRTANNLGLLCADKDAGFNLVNSHVSALFYYISKDYSLKEIDDPRFIKGRSAAIYCGGKKTGVFGEIHPQVLENWGIQMPCTICEIDLDILLSELAK